MTKNIDKSAIIQKMINNKKTLIIRVQNGENLNEVANDLGIKIVRLL